MVYFLILMFFLSGVLISEDNGPEINRSINRQITIEQSFSNRDEKPLPKYPPNTEPTKPLPKHPPDVEPIKPLPPTLPDK